MTRFRDSNAGKDGSGDGQCNEDAQATSVAYARLTDAPATPSDADESKGRGVGGSGLALVPFARLFAFADAQDVLLMAIGSLGAVAAGVAAPVQMVLLGDVLNAFNPRALAADSSTGLDAVRDDINELASSFSVVGAAAFVAGFLEVACWSVAAARQTRRLRSAYARSLLSQEMSWFDLRDTAAAIKSSDQSELSDDSDTKTNDAAPTTGLADDATTWAAIQDGAGSKIGDALRFAAMGVAGVTIGLATGWELALVLIAFTPVIALSSYVSVCVFARATQASIAAYARAGSIAREALANIRTVQSLGATGHFSSRYSSMLSDSTWAGIRAALAAGWGQGTMFFCIFCTYAAGLYVGAIKVADDQLGENAKGDCAGRLAGGGSCYDGGRVITVFTCVVMGAMALGNAGPCVRAIYAARASAVNVFAVIDRKSRIDPLAGEAEPKGSSSRALLISSSSQSSQLVATSLDAALAQPIPVSHRAIGHVTLTDVTFSYPSRPDAPPVCRSYSLTVNPGETVALVGPSGSGKSTVLALVQRLYDVDAGVVALDGVGVRAWPVPTLRKQFAVVSQEPTLFATSILENIRYGRPEATDEEVVAAATMANAMEFIVQLPQGLDTDVGEHGEQLSGGQRQRIAIARALLKDAPVLLLDEATSALDAKSEHAVQLALEHRGRLRTTATEHEQEEKVDEDVEKTAGAQSQGQQRRTTIVVAHRLATVRGADRIAFHRDGQVVEIGSHEELLRIPDGAYRAMVEAEAIKQRQQSNASVEGMTEIERELNISSTGEAGALAEEIDPDLGFPARSNTNDQTTVGTKKTLDEGDKVATGIINIQADTKTTSTRAEAHDIKSWRVPTRRLWRLAQPDHGFIALGAIGAVGSAALYPVWAILLTKLTVLYFRYDLTRSDMLSRARDWSLGFVGVAVTFLVCMTLQQYAFGVVSQRLIARVRAAAFSTMLRQEMTWFDCQGQTKSNGEKGSSGKKSTSSSLSGALAARLATDCAVLQAATSDALNARLVNFSTLGIALGVCFYYSWRLTLVMAATSPLFVLASYMELKQAREGANTKVQRDRDDANTDVEADASDDDASAIDSVDSEAAATALLSEAARSIRTVAIFGMELAISSRYDALLMMSSAKETRAGMRAGAMFGASLGLMFFVISFLVWIGGRWFADGHESFEDIMMVFTVVMLSAIAVGMAAQGPGAATSPERIRVATFHLFTIIDRVPAIGGDDGEEGVGMPKRQYVRGEIQFQSVAFSYPSRPDVPVYRDYTLHIGAGQTVALVGASGSGKSTAISLLERFYDPSGGSITLDGTDIRQLRLPWLRERISLVSQEPVLFAGTIADNIAMGKPGATREDVIDAAKKANAFDFISNFPNGFDTDVGDRGAQVSGGQKQRIAIARAILRDPEVLLLDEATSALDNESERVVQASLDALLAAKKRTTIVVAHRLSTIRNADLIAVTQGGAIVEQGTHDQLVKIPNGIYKALVERQITRIEA